MPCLPPPPPPHRLYIDRCIRFSPSLPISHSVDLSWTDYFLSSLFIAGSFIHSFILTIHSFSHSCIDSCIDYSERSDFIISSRTKHALTLFGFGAKKDRGTGFSVLAVLQNRTETLATQAKENFASVTSIARVWFVDSDEARHTHCLTR